MVESTRSTEVPTFSFAPDSGAESYVTKMPAIKLNALQNMTDDTGLIQHAVFSTPNCRHGYSIDDNARALALCTFLESAGDDLASTTSALAVRYRGYIYYAWNPTTSRFRNFLAYDRQWLEERGSQDSHARTVWALGTTLGHSHDKGACGLATELFERSLSPVQAFTSPRAWAFVILGITEYLRSQPDHEGMQTLRALLAERLFGLYHQCRDSTWYWFENILSYCNARLSQALLVAGHAHDRQDWLEAALESLQWFTDLQQTPTGEFDPIGSNGWYVKGGERVIFDQQPVEAYNQIAACVDAWQITGQQTWRAHARTAFEWFLGANRLHRPLYDATTGGCRDGLHPDRPNENQGAESIVSYLLARIDMGRLTGEIPVRAELA